MNHVYNYRGPHDPQPYLYYEPPFSEVSPPSPNDDPRAGCLAIIIGLLLSALLLWLLPSCSASRHSSSNSVHAISNIVEQSTAETGIITDGNRATQSKSEHTAKSEEIAHDTVIVNHTVVVREADSAELARYGVMLHNQQRAYLIQERELRERISLIKTSLTDSLRVLRDSLASLRSRDYSMLETSKSSVEESESRETKRGEPSAFWKYLGWVLLAISVIVMLLHHRLKH